MLSAIKKLYQTLNVKWIVFKVNTMKKLGHKYSIDDPIKAEWKLLRLKKEHGFDINEDNIISDEKINDLMNKL